jgi:CRISPR system Cascade subunit CasE
MHLSRLKLSNRCRANLKDLADCHQLHRTLMSAFGDIQAGKGAPRARFGLLYRVEEQEGAVILLIQSDEKPDWDRLDAARFMAPPECKDLDRLYGPLEAGQTLRFRLRANPTRKINTKSKPDGSRSNGQRVELRSEGEWLAWLGRKAGQHGFRLHSAGAAAEVPNVGTMPLGKLEGKKNGRSLTFFAVQFEGRLVIEDAALFKAALRNGIGPAKAYGFGLLSIAPG